MASSDVMRPQAGQQRSTLAARHAAPASNAMLGMRQTKLVTGAVMNSPALDQLKRTADKLVADQQSNKQDIAAYKQKLREEHDRCKALTAEKALVRAENCKLNSKIEDDQKHTQMMLQKMERVEDAQRLLFQHTSKLEDDLKEAEQLHTALRDGFDSRFTSCEALGMKADGLACVITELKQQLIQGKEEQRVRCTEMEGLQRELGVFRVQVADGHASQTAALAEWSKQRTELEEQLQASRQAIGELSQQVEKRDRAIDSLQLKQVEAAATHGAELSERHAELEAARGHVEGLDTSLTAAIAKHAEDYEEMKRQAVAIAERDSALDEQRRGCEQQNETLAALSGQLKSLEAAFIQLNAEHAAAQQVVAVGQTAAAQLTVEKEELACQISAVNTQKALLAEALEIKTQEANDAAQKLLTAATDAAEFKVDAEMKVAELSASVASLVHDAAAAKAAAEADLKRALLAADAKIRTYNERTNEILKRAREKAKQGTDEKIAQYKSDLEAAAKQMASLEARLAQTDASVESSALALAAAQQKHAAALDSLNASHAGTVKKMQEAEAVGSRKTIEGGAKKLKAAKDALASTVAERNAASRLADQLKLESEKAVKAAEAAEAREAAQKEEAAIAMKDMAAKHEAEAEVSRSGSGVELKAVAARLKSVTEELKLKANALITMEEARQAAEAKLVSALAAEASLRAELDNMRESAAKHAQQEVTNNQALKARAVLEPASLQPAPTAAGIRTASIAAVHRSDAEGSLGGNLQECSSPRMGSLVPPEHCSIFVSHEPSVQTEQEKGDNVELHHPPDQLPLLRSRAPPASAKRKKKVGLDDEDSRNQSVQAPVLVLSELPHNDKRNAKDPQSPTRQMPPPRPRALPGKRAPSKQRVASPASSLASDMMPPPPPKQASSTRTATTRFGRPSQGAPMAHTSQLPALSTGRKRRGSRGSAEPAGSGLSEYMEGAEADSNKKSRTAKKHKPAASALPATTASGKPASYSARRATPATKVVAARPSQGHRSLFSSMTMGTAADEDSEGDDPEAPISTRKVQVHGKRGASRGKVTAPTLSNSTKRPASQKAPPLLPPAHKKQRVGSAARVEDRGSPLEMGGFFGDATDPYDFFGG